MRKRYKKSMVMLLLMLLACSIVWTGNIMVPDETIHYPQGTADDSSADNDVKDENEYSIHYDPNDGVIHYGTIGEIGASEKKDVNNSIFRGTVYKKFPSYYMDLEDVNGNLLFPGAGENGYDYADMLTYAIDAEANLAAAGKPSSQIFVEEGVYYLGKNLPVWGKFTLNGVYGRTVFVCDNGNTALFKANSSNTYYENCSVTDIVFVAADAHEAFRADNTAEEIMKYVLSPEVKPVENFNCFEGMNISQSMISNNIFSGFQSPFAGIKGHMSTHISDNTVGPCRVVLQGTHFIDCYIHDNYFFGAPVNVEGHVELPLFTTGIGPNLTMINNNYLENFYFCKPASDTYGVTYTNNTFDHVYGIEFYTAGDATNAVSNCLFTDNTYGDIAAYFESFGYEPYSAGNKGENAYVIHAGSYNQRETDFNQMTAGNRSYIISCAGGTAITQCKFVEKDMSNTYLYHIANYSNQFRDKAISGTQVLDNAYEIDSFRKDDIFKDNTNLKDNGVSSEWQTKYFLSKKSSKEACIYYSPNGGVKIDLSCFYNPDSNETLGYAALGSVGAPDALFEEEVTNQLYEDLKAGRNIVYLSDFGAYPDDFGNDSSAIQKAFDTIAETGDILIVEGTYTISTPILLRGDKTYRVLGNGGAKAQNNKLVGGGFTLDVYSEQLAKTGAFVQGAKDTGKVSGYFMNINMYPNNIGQTEGAKYSGTCFYQVRFEHMQIKNLNAGYLDSVYKECTFEQCILEGGFVLYYSHGFMNRCIFTESVLQHIYATGSVQNYGIGCTYAYFLVDTDFVYSTMRTCWIEFMQFTNGFRFNGNGNSLYVGNVFDYVWNFQFGENDIFAGNNLTHNGTISITNHFIQYDNIPREKWSSEIREGNITTMHISDGLRLVGNVFSDGNSQYTTYLNFDGRTSLYPYKDKIVTSISNVRIGGNITGFAKNANEMPQFLYSDTLLKENCINNQIDLTSFAKSYKYIHDAQNYAYAKESCKNQLIPGTLVWLWNKEKENSSLFYYPSENNPVTLEPLPDKELEFNLTYDLPVEEKSKNTYSFDFVEDHLYLANEETTEVQGEIIGEYLKRIPFVSPLNETHLTPEVTFTAPDAVISYPNRTLYSQTSYMNGEEVKENTARSSLPPIYMFADTAFVDQYDSFAAWMHIPNGTNPIGDFPVLIYAEDEEYYYGVKVCLQNSYALRSQEFKVKKEYNGKVFGVNNNQGGILPCEWGKLQKASSSDISNNEKIKPGNNVSGNVYFDGTDIETSKENCDITIFDEFNLNKPILGLTYECNYNYEMNVAELYAVLDFSESYVSKDLENIVSKRKIMIGTYSVENLTTLAGVMFFNDAWIEKIEYQILPEFDRSDVTVFEPSEDEEEQCMHYFKEYIRLKPTCETGGFDSYICSACFTQLSYEQIAPLGHDFEETIIPPTIEEEGYTLCVCKRCGYEEKKDYVPKLEDESGEKPSEESSDEEPTEDPSDSQEEEDNGDVLPEDVPEDGIIPQGLWCTEIEPVIYSGKAVKPEIRVYSHNVLLQKGKDYTISYKNNKNATLSDDAKKAPSVIIKGKGNYSGKAVKTFDILPKNITDSDVYAEDISVKYNGKIQKKIPAIYWDNIKLSNKKDFVVSYTEDASGSLYREPGTYQIFIAGKGNYCGNLEIDLTVTSAKLMSKAKLSYTPKVPYPGFGAAVLSDLVVKYGSTILTENKDYVVSYRNNTSVRTATVIVEGIGEYAGIKQGKFTITGVPLNKAIVSGLGEQIYTGRGIEPEFSVMLNDAVLVKDTDYTVSYVNNMKAGTATLQIRGIGKYTGVCKKQFRIKALDLFAQNSVVSGMPAGTGLGDYEYEKGGTKPVFELKHNGVILQAGKDYTLKYRNHTQITHRDEITPVNDKVPFATVEVRGKGNYTGVKTYTYCILPCKLQTSGGRVKLSVSDVVYKKKAGNYISKPVLKDANGKILKAGTDYDKEVIYLLPDGMILDKKMTVSVGATIYGQVNGKGNYSGSIRFSYMIKPIDFKKASVKIRSQVYNGKEITLSADDIVVKHDGNTLEMGKDFIILEDSYKNNIQKGTAKVTVMGIGEYAGMKEVSYKITSKQLIWGKFLQFIDR